MYNDNVMPNDGAAFAFTEPSAQKVERTEEIAKTLLAIPRLQEEIARLDEKITFYSSTGSITGEALANKDLFMHTYAAYQIVAQILSAERSEILSHVENAIDG